MENCYRMKTKILCNNNVIDIEKLFFISFCYHMNESEILYNKGKTKMIQWMCQLNSRSTAAVLLFLLDLSRFNLDLL